VKPAKGKEGGKKREKEGGKVKGRAPPPFEDEPAYLDLTSFSSAHELEPLGLNRLKAALLHWGVKCGGTLEERATRLFSLKGVKDMGDINPKLLAKKK
ncbi:splicing factor 3a subunit 3-like, partial [Nannochloropsis oceanica]